MFRIVALAAVLVLIVANSAVAQQPRDVSSPTPAPPNLTGNWGGARTTLAAKGITFRGHYVGEAAANPLGGVRQGTALANEFMLGADVDFNKLTGDGLGILHVTFTERWGSSLSKNAVGNLMTVQEIYGDGLTPRLTELSFEQPLLRNKIDLEFGRVITENDFAASSVYWGNSLYCDYQSNAICGTPIAAPLDSGYVAYPSSAWGARIKGFPSSHWYVESGAYEVNPTLGLSGNGFKLDTSGATGVYLPFETGVKLGDAGTSLGDVRVGGYYDTSTVAGAESQLAKFVPANAPVLSLVSPAVYAGRYGYWIQADHLIEGSGAVHAPGTAVFAAYEFGDPRTSLLTSFADLGILRHGTFAGRNDDTASLGFVYANVNPDLRSFESFLQGAGFGGVPTTGQEKVVELNYNAQVEPWMTLRPGLQYVIDPSGETAIHNALVIDLSTVISL